jgi:hypothetical protein
MPALAPITVTDGAATPASHVFNPVSTNGSRAELANRASGVTPNGWELLNIEVKKPAQQGGANRVIITMYDPTEVTVDQVTSVTKANSAKFELNFAQLSTLQDRKDLLAMAASLLVNGAVKTVVENLEPIY